jgi:hypothetical protein
MRPKKSIRNDSLFIFFRDTSTICSDLIRHTFMQGTSPACQEQARADETMSTAYFTSVYQTIQADIAITGHTLVQFDARNGMHPSGCGGSLQFQLEARLLTQDFLLLRRRRRKKQW